MSQGSHDISDSNKPKATEAGAAALTVNPTVTIQMGDENGSSHGGVTFDGLSDYTNDVTAWGVSGSPAQLTSIGAPQNGGGAYFAPSGVGVHCLAQPPQPAGDFDDYEFTGASLTDGVNTVSFNLIVRVYKKALAIRPVGQYGIDELEAVCRREADGVRSLDDLTVLMRAGGDYDLYGARTASPPVRPLIGRMVNQTVGTLFEGTDRTFGRYPRVSQWYTNGSLVNKVTFRHIDFHIAHDRLVGPSFEIWGDNSGGRREDFLFEDCRFSSTVQAGRTGYPRGTITYGLKPSGSRMTVRRCVFDGLTHCIYASGEDILIEENDAYANWADFVAGNQFDRLVIRNNDLYEYNGDVNSLHPDFFQLQSEWGRFCLDFVIEGNVVWPGAEGAWVPTQTVLLQAKGRGRIRQISVDTTITGLRFFGNDTNSREYIRVDASAGDVTLTIDNPVNITSMVLQRWDGSSNTVIVTPDGGVTTWQLDGEWDIMRVDFDGTNWIMTPDVGWQGRNKFCHAEIQNHMLYQGGRIAGNLFIPSTVAGINIQELSTNTLTAYNTISRSFPGDYDGDGIVEYPDVPAALYQPPDLSSAVMNTVCHTIGTPFQLDSVSGFDGAQSDPTSFLSAGLFNGTTEEDFRPMSRIEALTAYLAKPGGPLDDGEQIGALGTALTNGVYDFVNRRWRDQSAPTIVATSGDPLHTWDPVWIGFDRPIALGRGDIRIHRTSDNALLQTYNCPLDAGPGEYGPVFVSGKRLYVYPVGWYDNFTNWATSEYYIQFDAGSIVGFNGVSCAALTDAETWHFTPRAGSVSPNIFVGARGEFALSQDILIEKNWVLRNAARKEALDPSDPSAGIVLTMPRLKSETLRYDTKDPGIHKSTEFAPGQPFTFSVEMRPHTVDPAETCSIRIRYFSGSFQVGAPSCGLSFATNEASSGGTHTAAVEVLADGWRRLSLSGTMPAGTNRLLLNIGHWNAVTASSNKVQLRRPQIEQSSVANPWQAPDEWIKRPLEDNQAPVIVSSTVDESILLLRYTEALDGLSVPANDDYVVLADGGPLNITSVAISGSDVTLTLGAPVTGGQVVSLDYTSGINPLRDVAGNPAPNVTGRSITNLSPVATPPVLQSAVVNADSLILTYNEDLDTGSVPTPSDFSVVVASVMRGIDTVSISGTIVTLTLNSAVSQGQAVTISYTPGTTPIQDIAGSDAAALLEQAVANTTSSAPASENILQTGAQALNDPNVWEWSNKTVLELSPGIFEITDTGPGDYLRYNTLRKPGEALISGNRYTFAIRAKQGVGSGIFKIEGSNGFVQECVYNFSSQTWTTTPPAGIELNTTLEDDADGMRRLAVSWTQSGSNLVLNIARTHGTGQSHIASEPMLWNGLFSETGWLPYQDPD